MRPHRKYQQSDMNPADLPAFNATVAAMESPSLIRVVLALERRGEITAAGTLELIRAVAQHDGSILKLAGVTLPALFRRRYRTEAAVACQPSAC